eukprot:NODE_93_length_21581_cov_0.291919.p13 type:complete len:112 gc:universal NODE_93_length_21581_cov_0.291919:16104-15769(-)
MSIGEIVIKHRKYGNDDVLIVSKSGKIGSIYQIGRGMPVPLFGGKSTTLSEWNDELIVPKLTVYSLIEQLKYSGYLLTDIHQLQKIELEVILERIDAMYNATVVEPSFKQS